MPWQRAALPETDLALIGFSQGTMMALHVGLRRAKPVAAIVGYSGMLVAPELLGAEVKSKPPVLLVHGMADPVLPFSAMGEAETALSLRVSRCARKAARACRIPSTSAAWKWGLDAASIDAASIMTTTTTGAPNTGGRMHGNDNIVKDRSLGNRYILSFLLPPGYS